MSIQNIVTVQDSKGYRQEVWSFDLYQEMEDYYDNLLAEGSILDWYISNIIERAGK
jgi:hypothetical protein